MIKIILLFLFLLTHLNAKQDFYYSFIDDDKQQISQIQKDKILSVNYKLETIKRLVREGQLDKAYKNIVKLKDTNKQKIFTSNIILLYSEIVYKQGGNINARKAIDVLEKAISNSDIKSEDLLNSYRLLVTLTIQANKLKEAKYYAKTIAKTFDDPLSKSYGQISLAQIAIHKRAYKKAIKILYNILVTTKDMDVATVVADELYDVYILDHQDEKAYELVGKVLKKNIKYYANDSFLALKKVDKLLNANMPNFAIDILEMLLKNAVEPESIARFKFRLANTYMKMAGYKKGYMSKAKELYKDLIVNKNSPYKKQVRIAMDEILMREGKVEPAQIASKYNASVSMEQKVLLQELLNNAKENKYDYITKMYKIYKQITPTITKRFGYENIQAVYDSINSQMVKYYLDNEKCVELSTTINLVTNEALEELVQDKNSSEKFFTCLVEVPDKRSYNIAKKTFASSKKAKIYFSLEQVALSLDKADDAYSFIQKIDMLNDNEIKKQEFLYRFLVYGKLNNNTSMDQFFKYTLENPEYITANENNPLIIDFYYHFYLYLQKAKKEKQALKILNKLNEKQTEMKAYVYSPYVELELLKELKLDEKYTQAITLLEDTLINTRHINDNNLANIYYEMAKIYEKLNKTPRYEKAIYKCQELKKADNLYKKMCDKL